MRYYLKPRHPGGILYICWTNPDGSPGRITTGTRDSREAELALAEHILQNGRPKDQRLAETTIAAVLVRYWTHYAQQLFDRGVIKRVIGLVVDHAPTVSLADFTIARQEQFVTEAMPSVVAGTRRRYMGVIEAAVNWSYQRGEIERPIPFVRPEAVDGPGAIPLTPVQMGQFLAAAKSEHERGLALLLVTTGPRPQAILQLDWQRLQGGAVDYNVPGRRLTKKRRAHAPLAGTVARYFEARRSIGAVIQYRGRALKGHRMTIDRIMARAGLGATAYSVRKGLATWLARQGVPESEYGTILGHRVQKATTARYAHLSPDWMKATKRAVEALLQEIAPSWLASYLPLPAAAAQPAMKISMTSNGLVGSREWDRTTDHFHVKDGGPLGFQDLIPSNDD